MSDVLRQIEGLEKQRKTAEEAVARRDMALKLASNREFKKLILDEFCGTECARYAQASADPNLDSVKRADALAIAQAAGHLRRYMSVLLQMGDKAAQIDIPSIDEALVEARQEEQDEDDDVAVEA